MALPSSGNISLSQVNTELALSATAQISLNDTAVRTLAGKASGAIRMNDLYGTSSAFTFTISSNQLNANLRTLAVAAGWNQSSAVNATIGSSVYVWSDNTSTPALTIDGSWPGGVTLVNNGYIMGKGGTGGSASGYLTWYEPGAGGPALSIGTSGLTITNNLYIGGGGGGGGTLYAGGGGGGAGGGDGGNIVDLNYGNTIAGGSGGSVGSVGGNGSQFDWSTYTKSGFYAQYDWAGGAGGRIMPGVGGTSGSGGGAGGGGGTIAWYYSSGGYYYDYGQSGGSAGNAGTMPSVVPGMAPDSGAGGGGWGASGGTSNNIGGYSGQGTTYIGASGGKAISLNGYSVTRNGSGTTYGAVS
jgi:hypothetical protein